MFVDFGQECFASLLLDLSQHKYLSLALGHLLCLFHQLKMKIKDFWPLTFETLLFEFLKHSIHSWSGIETDTVNSTN